MMSEYVDDLLEDWCLRDKPWEALAARKKIENLNKMQMERKKREDALLLNAALEQEEEEREHHEG